MHTYEAVCKYGSARIGTGICRIYIYVELWLQMYRDAHRCVVVLVFVYVHVHGPVSVYVYLHVYFTYIYLSMYVYIHAYT